MPLPRQSALQGGSLMQRISPTEAYAIAGMAMANLKRRASAGPAPLRPDELQVNADTIICADFPNGFRTFLNYWQFVNRDTGAVLSFETLWPGQAAAADLMVSDKWLFLLKAGKLGFTELECAWDGYVASFGPPNGRIHLFSKEGEAAKNLLDWVRFGLRHLPPAFGVRILPQERGGDTARSLRLSVNRPGMTQPDQRMIYAYATSLNMGIDQVCVHAHVDEWAHMKAPGPRDVWATIPTTVSPSGSCHIVTRGAGPDDFVQQIWENAASGEGRLRGYFAPWYMRPDRDGTWLEEQAAALATPAAVGHFAPETPEDAFLGDEEDNYITVQQWDACLDPELPPLLPGDRTPLIVGMDAGVTNDTFAIVAVSRHPNDRERPAVRAVKVFRPQDFEGHEVDFYTVENWMRVLCRGGCLAGHAQSVGFKQNDCEFCERGELQPGFNVPFVVFDPYQLKDMAQSFKRWGIAAPKEFNQVGARAKADRELLNKVLRRELAHNGDAILREHIGNAKAKTQNDEDSKLRMVKKSPNRKIDAAVACSMAVSECMRLNM